MNTHSKKQIHAIIILLLFSGFTLFISCNSGKENPYELIIFHAGSLSVPFKELKEKFNDVYPEVKIVMEAAGSVACARKITDLNRECDIMASADYKVIEKFLIPEYTAWHIPFATNKMVIAYSEDSKYSNEISDSNWVEILLHDEVLIGRADPNADPCGYRTVLVAKLAELFYNEPDLAEKLLAKNPNLIRPKEVDLIALLQSHTLDYFFIYKSVAQQHDLMYLELPDDINLGNPEFSAMYHTVSTKIYGDSPDNLIEIKGEPMVYGITILENAPNRETAESFVAFLLSEEGMAIIENNGQSPINILENNILEDIPNSLKKKILMKYSND